MTMQRPALGNQTQGYGATHRGIDYGWGAGFGVYAAEAGTVSYDWTAGYGHRLSIDHGVIGGERVFSRYAHLGGFTASSGWVSKGQHIATMGSTGSFADDSHLHFEVLADFVKVNPALYFASGIDGAGTPGTTLPPAPASETRTDFDMILLFITDNADGNGRSGWWWVNPAGGGFIALSSATPGAQAQADSWARTSGGSRPCTRQDGLNLIAGIKQTAPTAAGAPGAVDATALAGLLAPQLATLLAPHLGGDDTDEAAIITAIEAALIAESVKISANIDAVPAEVIIEQKKPGN